MLPSRLRDQQIESAVNELGDVAIGDLMPHELLRRLEFVVQLLIGRELHLVAVRPVDVELGRKARSREQLRGVFRRQSSSVHARARVSIAR
jgi:hypothetical protein